MTLILPLVMEASSGLDLSDLDLSRLEREGGIQLSNELRRQLKDLAHFWNGHLHSLQTPRPKQFRGRLVQVERTLKEAHAALDLNRSGAAMWERHLFNWARNSGVEEAKDFFTDAADLLDRIDRMSGLVSKLKKALPKDAGGRRKQGDESFFLVLANVFERAGGRALAYRSEATAGGIADTPFRRFVHSFYRCFPASLRRASSGVDEALLAALRKRRRLKSKKG